MAHSEKLSRVFLLKLLNFADFLDLRRISALIFCSVGRRPPPAAARTKKSTHKGTASYKPSAI